MTRDGIEPSSSWKCVNTTTKSSTLFKLKSYQVPKCYTFKYIKQ